MFLSIKNHILLYIFISISFQPCIASDQNDQVEKLIQYEHLKELIHNRKLQITIGSPLFLYIVFSVLRQFIPISGGVPKEAHKIIMKRTINEATISQNEVLNKNNIENTIQGYPNDMLATSYLSTYYIISDNKLNTPIYTNATENNSAASTDILTIHGFGCHPYNNLSEFDSSYRHWLVCFEDAEKNLVLKTSFGSGRDIKIVLITLLKIVQNYTDENNEKKIILSAHSRGCDPTVQALTELQKNTQSKIIRKLEISNEQCLDILQRIERGYMRLKCPMKSRPYVIQSRIQNNLSHTTENIISYIAGKYIGSFTGKCVGSIIGYPIGTFTNKILSPLATNFRCKPWDTSAIDCINNLEGLNLKTLLIFAQHDSVVGDDLNEKYINEFKQVLNKEEDNVFVFNYEGDHNHVLNPYDYHNAITTFHSNRCLQLRN